MNIKLAAVTMALIGLCSINQATADSKVFSGRQAQELLAEGKVLSSALLSGTGSARIGVPPTDTRIHELFILYQDEIFLCHLVGSKSSPSPAWASCFGELPN